MLVISHHPEKAFTVRTGNRMAKRTQVIVSSEDNQVTSEEAIMTVNNDVVVYESITIDQ